jgi:hypothetical protein
LEPTVLSPTVIAALVSASGALLGKVIEWVGRKDDAAQEQAKEVIGKTYDTLRANFTDGCVTALKLLENGEAQMPYRIRERMYPQLNLPQDVVDQLDGEFRYRLEYLRLNGVVTLVGAIEYGITRLGQAFLAEARRRRDYYKVLFGS